MCPEKAFITILCLTTFSLLHLHRASMFQADLVQTILIVQNSLVPLLQTRRLRFSQETPGAQSHALQKAKARAQILQMPNVIPHRKLGKFQGHLGGFSTSLAECCCSVA